jgi:hypothetical protein
MEEEERAKNFVETVLLYEIESDVSCRKMRRKRDVGFTFAVLCFLGFFVVLLIWGAVV